MSDDMSIDETISAAKQFVHMLMTSTGHPTLSVCNHNSGDTRICFASENIRPWVWFDAEFAEVVADWLDNPMTDWSVWSEQARYWSAALRNCIETYNHRVMN